MSSGAGERVGERIEFSSLVQQLFPDPPVAFALMAPGSESFEHIHDISAYDRQSVDRFFATAQAARRRLVEEIVVRLIPAVR